MIFWGGWEGHTPEQSAAHVASVLEGHGVAVTVQHGIAGLVASSLDEFDLIVPMITMATIEKEELDNLLATVRAGTGFAGFHGTMCDALRNEPGYPFMTGGQWVAHPGNIIDYTINIGSSGDPIVAGIEDFSYTSEQYYLPVDPSVEVLATTTFDGSRFAGIDGVVMPVLWKRRFGGGRVFYSALGHVVDEFKVPQTNTLFERGALWAMR